MAQTRMNMSHILQAINATQQLRSTVTNVFSFLCDGFKAEEDQEVNDDADQTLSGSSVAKDPKKFLLTFQNYLQAVNQDYNEVEKFCNLMTTNAELQHLGPSGSISQDSVSDKSATYRNMSFAYQWHHRMHEYSAQAFTAMQTHPVKKGQYQAGQFMIAKKRRPTTHKFLVPNLNSQIVDTMLHNLSAQTKDSTFKVMQVAGDIRVVQVSIGRVFNAFIVMRYFYLEKVLVKGQGEDFFNEDGTVDLFSSSQFESMRTITDHATSALLEYSPVNTTHSEVSLRFLLLWLQSYKNLFTEKCSVCGKHMFAGLPPLWRDFRDFSGSHGTHDVCRG